MTDGRPLPPDLQEWVTRYGGYSNIPWPLWDAAVAAWRRAYFASLGGPITDEERRDHARKHKKAVRR